MIHLVIVVRLYDYLVCMWNAYKRLRTKFDFNKITNYHQWNKTKFHKLYTCFVISQNSLLNIYIYIYIYIHLKNFKKPFIKEVKSNLQNMLLKIINICINILKKKIKKYFSKCWSCIRSSHIYSITIMIYHLTNNKI